LASDAWPSHGKRHAFARIADPHASTGDRPGDLISGVGLLLLCMTNRIARVIDRTRIVAADCEIVGHDEREVCYAKLDILSQRAKFLRTSISMAAVSVLLVAVLVILLFCGALFGVEIAGVIVALFVGCMCSLIVSLVFFIRDVNVSLQALWLDVPAGQREQVLTASPRSVHPAGSFPRPSGHASDSMVPAFLCARAPRWRRP
jgi:hypothetical protein